MTGTTVSDTALAADETMAPQVGAKAANLGRLVAAGYRVPPFVVLSAAACARILEPIRGSIADALDSLDHTVPASLRAASEEIRTIILAQPIPADIDTELGADVREIVDRTPQSGARLAVRSSVSGEDSATDSFAGQLDTLLNVAPADVSAAVLEVLAFPVERAVVGRPGSNDELYRLPQTLGHADRFRVRRGDLVLHTAHESDVETSVAEQIDKGHLLSDTHRVRSVRQRITEQQDARVLGDPCKHSG